MNERSGTEIKNWQKVFLKDNPFAIVPGRISESVKWANMVILKDAIEKRMISSVQTSPSCIILNWGEWGGGKTHAGLYFTQDYILKEIAEKANTRNSKAFLISLPRASKEVIKVLYLDVIGKIGFRNLWQFVQKFYKALGTDSFKVLSRLCGNEEFAEVIVKLAKTKKENDIYQSLRAYFNLAITKTELRKLGFVRSIESVTDMISILTTILNIMVLGNTRGLPLYSEVFLWFDELEDIITLPTKEGDMLRNLLRDLIDYVPQNLTVFLNFTRKTGIKFEDLFAYLGDALMSRLRRQYIFEFSFLSEKDALKYIKDLISFSRPKKKAPTDYYPFEEKALKTLIGRLELRTPRKINEECTLLLESAISEPSWEAARSVIDTEFVKKNLPSLFERK